MNDSLHDDESKIYTKIFHKGAPARNLFIINQILQSPVRKIHLFTLWSADFIVPALLKISLVPTQASLFWQSWSVIEASTNRKGILKRIKILSFCKPVNRPSIHWLISTLFWRAGRKRSEWVTDHFPWRCFSFDMPCPPFPEPDGNPTPEVRYRLDMPFDPVIHVQPCAVLSFLVLNLK